jgi:lecithin-cholesterol acyltransferase
MFSLIPSLAAALKPVVMVPGHFGSRLHVNTTRQSAWYCPKSLVNRHAWIRVRDLFPPYIFCLLDYLTVDLDNSTGELRSQIDTNVTTVDFGRISGIRGIGPDYFGHYLPVNYESYISSFLRQGYRIGVDLFSAPYDWRFGLDQPATYFNELRSLIERASAASDGARVALLSHAMGSTLTHLFLTEKMTKEWRDRYIDSSTYVSPSWTGSGQSLFAIWRRRFPYIPLKFSRLSRFVASIGAFHAQLPNAVAYANTTLLVDPDGKNHTGTDLIDFLRQHGKLKPAQLRIAERNFKFAKMLPKTPDFKVNILYNSGVQTPMGLKLRSWTDVGTPIYGRGDSLVGSKVIDWACATWKQQDIDVLCHDVESAEKRYHHRYILKTPEIANLITKWILGTGKNVGDSFDREL